MTQVLECLAVPILPSTEAEPSHQGQAKCGLFNDWRTSSRRAAHRLRHETPRLPRHLMLRWQFASDECGWLN